MTEMCQKDSPDLKSSSTYEPLAQEYYDTELHPTCAAFREASEIILDKFFIDFPLQSNRCAEVGAGKSMLLPALWARKMSASEVWLIDNSPSMLEHSSALEGPNIRRALCSAADIAKLGVEFDIIVCSLGDPYNTKEFWKAIRQSLSPSGRCLFTTPSYEWASRFRLSQEGEKKGQALFKNRFGRAVYVPSIVLGYLEQERLVQSQGLEIEIVLGVPTSGLSRVPPKLQEMSLKDPIVSGYVVRNLSYSALD